MNASLAQLHARLRPRLRPALVALVALVAVAEVLALTPSRLEVPSDSDDELVPEALVDIDARGAPTLATGIPERVPEYSVDKFVYVSAQAEQKQWKLVAERAFLYNRERIVHARTVTAYLYDPDGKITVVTGNEAKYAMSARDLEVYGNVVTRFPDGFEMRSDYMKYLPTVRKVEVPERFAVQGKSGEDDPNSQQLEFQSQGMEFKMARNEIILPSSVVLRSTRESASAPDGKETTTIESDRAVMERDRQIAHFTMNSSRPLESRFVHVLQPTLDARSRRANLRYGTGEAATLQYLTLFEDVLVRETGKKLAQLRYGTGGRADFDNRRNVIVLREFPQVYQDKDTVTGDIIILHRDTDIVEVEHSNAFSDSGVDER